MTSIGPYRKGVEEFRPRRGQSGEERKSVKKRAALLHVLVFCFLDHLIGVPRGERLAAHNERRQFAAQTRSCGYSPRWGEHCSLPGFAALNRGPLLATPQSPRPGFAASEQRDFFRFLFWSQKRKVSRKYDVDQSAPPQGGGTRHAHARKQNQNSIKSTATSQTACPSRAAFRLAVRSPAYIFAVRMAPKK